MKKNKTKNERAAASFLYDEHGEKVGVRLDRKEYERLINLVNDYHDYQAILKYQKKRK